MNPERLGPYKIVDRIGAGGMGEVFKGVHDETGDVVAVKLLALEEGDDPQLLKRFRREIVSASRLSHDNIVRLLDSGEQDEQIWYAMEYIDGSPLSGLLAQGRPLPIPEVYSIGKDLCKAFVYMHSRGFVHRDIKPGNIMIAKEGTAKLVDFGLVKSRFATNITMTGIVVGTPAFMSPEMLQGRDVDHRSDIFQLGQVIFKMAAGQGAFDGPNSFDTAHNTVASPPRPLLALNPQATPALESVIALCLEKKPEDRYQSAADVLNDLRRVEKNLKPVGTGRKAPAGPQTPVTQPLDLRNLASARPVAQGWAWPRVAAGMLLAVVTGAAAVHFAARQQHVDFSARNVRFEAGLRAVSVKWESEQPYPTRVLYSAGASGQRVALAQEVVNAEASSATSHSLRLRGLEPGGIYTIKLVYPDGSASLPQTFRTASQGLGAHAFSCKPDGTPVLDFATLSPVTATVRYSQGREVRSSARAPSTSHSVVLTGAGCFGEGTALIICANSLGETWSEPPLALPDARAEARDLVLSLQGVQSRIAALMAALDRAEHQRKLDPGLVKDALPRGILERIARFAPLGPVFFSSRKPSLEEKLALYRQLSPMDALDRYCVRRKLPFDTGIRRLLGEDFGPSLQPRLPKASAQKWAEQTHLVSSGVSAAQADVVSAFGKTTQMIKVPLFIEGAASIKKAELTVGAVQESGILFEDEIAVLINRSFELVLRHDPATPRDQTSIRFVHGLDPRMLSEGENELRLTLRPMAGLKNANEIVIREVVLRTAR